MLKKTLTYKDFDDNEVTETFYFNITKAELVVMEQEVEGGWSNKLKAVVLSGDPAEIFATLEDLIRRSYGVRSEDGRQFVKTPKDWEEFRTSEAYSALFMEFVTSPTASIEFMAGVLPNDLVSDAGGIEKLMELELPNPNKAVRPMTELEKTTAAKAELVEAFRQKNNARAEQQKQVEPPSTVPSLASMTREEVLELWVKAQE